MADESYVALCAVVEHLHKENDGKAPTPEQLADALGLSIEEAKEILAELDADPPVLAEPLPKKPKKEVKAKKEKKSLRGASQPAEGATAAAAPSHGEAEVAPPTVPPSGFEDMDDEGESPAFEKQAAGDIADTQLDASPTASEKPALSEKPVPSSTQSKVALKKGDSHQFLPYWLCVCNFQFATSCIFFCVLGIAMFHWYFSGRSLPCFVDSSCFEEAVLSRLTWTRWRAIRTCTL